MTGGSFLQGCGGIESPLPVSTNDLRNVVGADHTPRHGRADCTALCIRNSQIMGMPSQEAEGHVSEPRAALPP